MRMFGFEEQARPIPVHTGSIWHFSKTEINHLTLATLAFTMALAFMFSGGILGALSDPSAFLVYGVLALITFTPSGLRIGVLLAAILGIVFMAPGAVMVAGNTTREQFGKVALAGPVSNVVLWCIGLASAVAFGGGGGIVDDVIYYWMWANGILGALNMLPFGPLDGKKIKTWSDVVFWLWLTITFSMVWFNLNQLGALLG